MSANHTATPVTWQLELLGGLRATRGPRVLARFPTRKTGHVLAMLALEPERPRTRDAVIDAFWSDSEPAAGRNSLSGALSALRRLLEPAEASGSVLVSDRHHVGLAPGAVETDVARLRAAWDAARRLDPDGGRYLDLLLEAAELYRGELLPGADGDWVDTERASLARLHVRILEHIVERHMGDGNARAAVGVARRAVAAEPLRESTHRQLMLALIAAGRQAEAAHHYRRFELLLRAELGVEPGPETRSVAAALHRGGPTSAAVTSGTASGPPAAAEPTAAQPAPPTGVVTAAVYLAARRSAPATELASLLGDLARRVRALDGTVVKPGTAEVWVLFRHASDAAAAAAGAVSAAHASGIQLRVGIHTGELQGASLPDAAPVGPLARRLAEIAHPYRVLLTEEAALLARPGLEADDRLMELGRFALRSGLEPERLFELRAAGRPAHGLDGPPLSISAAQTSRLPLRLSRFIDREAECHRLLELLTDEQTRLVTITGMGGTGKTRLALEAASRWERATGHGATWVDLEHLADPRHLGGAIAGALGVSAPAAGGALQAAQERLAGLEHLLVLDNFEQLAAEGALQVRQLLVACPRLRCLATSRARLALEGECELALRPLPLPGPDADADSLPAVPSVHLFVDRARAACSDFAFGSDNAADIARLCVALEGLPLAIELAAAQAAVLTPRRMLERLQDRLAWLAVQRADLSDRQRSLRGAFDASYALLGPRARTAFQALSVFRGGWNLEAAEAVLDDPLALERIAELRAGSLVAGDTAGGDVRFTMLDAVRLYAAERLEPARGNALRSRHAAHFAAVADAAKHALVGPDQKAWLERLALDDDNLWAALDWCATDDGDTAAGLRLVGGLQYYWFTRGHMRAGLEATERLLGRPDAGAQPLLRAAALRVAGGLATFLADHERAAGWLEQALALQRRAGAPLSVAAVLYQLAMLAQVRDRDDEARLLAEECAQLYRSLEGPQAARGLAAVANVLGVLERRRGDLVAARAHLLHSLTLLDELGDARARADVLDNLAQVEMDCGRLAESRAHIRDMARIAEDLGSEWGQWKSLWLLALVKRRQRRYRYAARLLGAAEAHRRRIAPPRAEAYAVTDAAELAALRERLGEDLLDRCLDQGRAWDWTSVVRRLRRS